MAESRVPGTLELPGVVPAGQKHGTDVADGLIWLGLRLCSSLGKSGRHRRHNSGIVRLPVVRPDLEPQAWDNTPLELSPTRFRVRLADVDQIITCDGTAGQGSGNQVGRVEKICYRRDGIGLSLSVEVSG